MVAAKIKMQTLTTVLRIAPADEVNDFYPLKLNWIGSAYKSVARKLSLARWRSVLFFSEDRVEAFLLLRFPRLKNFFVALLNPAPIY